MGYGAVAMGEVTEQRKEGEGEGVTETQRSRTGRGLSWRRVTPQSQDGCWGCGGQWADNSGEMNARGGSGVHLPRKKIPGCQGVLGDAFSSHSHFSHQRPNPSFIPTKLCPLAQSYVCQTCPVTSQDRCHPSPQTASIAPTWTSRQLGPQSLRAATRGLGSFPGFPGDN